MLASRALGVAPPQLILRHIAPNLAPLLLTHAGANAGLTVVAYASLAFLGLGADPSQADWGTMLFEYRLFIIDDPKLMLAPGLGIALTALALNLTLDPTQVGRKWLARQRMSGDVDAAAGLATAERRFVS